jgi:hypothetical protein
VLKGEHTWELRITARSRSGSLIADDHRSDVCSGTPRPRRTNVLPVAIC